MEDKKEKLPSTRIQWYPGHMAKTRREIEQDLKLIDVVIELLDARIPLSSRNPEIKKITNNKKKIIILNKSDMADEEMTKKWVAALSKEAKVLVTDANTGKGIDKVSKAIDEIMKDEVEKQKARGIKNKTIRVMILGIPNVGKSSFINRISKKSALVVGNRPGVTRQKQWIRIGNNQELLDTPGVLWPKFESNEVALNLAFTGSIKDDLLEIVDIAYDFLKLNFEKHKEKFVNRYNLTPDELKEAENDSNKFYAIMKLIGRKRGALLKGNEVDDEKTARLILDDFRSTKLGRITLEEPK